MNKKIKKILIALIIIFILAITAAYLFFTKQFSRPSTNLPEEKNIILQDLPCNPVAQAELGYPYVFDNQDPAAEFTTAGGKLYIAAKYFNHGGFFGSYPGSTAIYMGNIAVLPVYDSQRDIVNNSTKRISVPEKKYTEFQLPAGRYWLWSTTGGGIVLYSCDPNGVSDPKPVQ